MKVPSKGKVVLPGHIVGRNVLINTDIVDSDIPLLFSRDALKSLGAKIDYSTDEAIILGKSVVLSKTSVGHHCVSLLPEDLEVVNAVQISNLTLDEKTKVIRKLHRQYGHPGKRTFMNHLKTAGFWSEDCGSIIEELYDQCGVCKQYAKTPSRPVVALPMATEFNECVAIDLKYWRQNLWILHMIDVYSRFTQSVFISSKSPKVVIDAILVHWVGNFGVMRRLFSDCGGEFNNQDMREISSLLNIEVKTTAGYAPFQNGLCERNHAVVDMILHKLVAEYPNTELNVLLKWANMAKNSLQMWSGFSSYQLVFGSNPNLPNVMTDKVPALEDGSANDLYRKHISALQTAREEFLKTEASGRLKRAFRSNIRASEQVFQSGDCVYYKREGNIKWLGPAKVIDQDGKIVYVIHGSHLVRVSTSRLMHTERSNATESISDCDPDDNQVSDSIQGYEIIRSKPNTETESRVLNDDAASQNKSQSEGLESRVVRDTSQPTETIKISRQLARLKDHNKPGKKDLAANTILQGDDVSSAIRGAGSELQGDEESSTISTTASESNNLNEEVLSVCVPKSQHNSIDCLEAKQNELEKLKEFHVYEEVPDEGQICISTRWVIVQKGEKSRPD